MAVPWRKEYEGFVMDTQIEKALSSLQTRHINGIFTEDRPEANRKILSLITFGATVGIGDSTSMRELGILDLLKERGTRILDPFHPMNIQEYRQRERLRKETTLCDVFLTGTNALTSDGRLVNVDVFGNRVAGMFWGILYPSSSPDETKSSETWMKPSTGFGISLLRTILRSGRHWGAEKGRPPAL
jgi:hypothetical protein